MKCINMSYAVNVNAFKRFVGKAITVFCRLIHVIALSFLVHKQLIYPF